MTERENYLQEQKDKLLKALAHLEYSYKKVTQLPDNPDQLDDEMLETWESFAARFGRVADIFIMKYLRACILQQDSGFIGSVRDMLNQAEKLRLIDSAESWMIIRGLRNISSHEYTDKDLAEFFKRLKAECPRLLAIKQGL